MEQEHPGLVEMSGEMSALAVENARLRAEARERASYEALIHRIALAIGSSLELDRIMDTAVQELRAATNCSRSAVVLASLTDGFSWTRWESRAEGVPPMGERPIPWRNEPRIREMMAKREPVALDDIESEPLPEQLLALARGLGVKSVLAMPLFRGEQPIGGVELYQYRQARRWTDREKRLIQSVAAQLAVAVENARLYGETDEKLRARVRQLGGLLRLTTAVSEQLSLEAVMERAVEEGIRALDVDRCAIATMDWESGLFTVRSVRDRGGEAHSSLGALFSLANVPDVYRALSQRKPVALSMDDPMLPSGMADLLRRTGVSFSIVVPLITRERVVGIVHFGRRAGRPRFAEDDAALATAVAGQLAVAMENARLFQEVQAQKANREAMLASMSEGMYATDLEGRITSANPALEKLVGRRVQEMVGMHCREVLRHSDEEGLALCSRACPMSAAMEKGEAVESGWLFTQTAWGRWLPSTMSAAPMRNSSGAIDGAVAVLRDISREWQLNKLRANIISIVSHEFRTPLTSIIGFSEFMLMRPQTEEERRSHLDQILREGLRLEKLVNDFLDVSRLESDKMVLHLETVHPASIVQRCISEVRSPSGPHQVVSDLPEGLLQIEVDPEKLVQILENLLSNALKYSPPEAMVVVRAGNAATDSEGRLQFGLEGPERWVVFTVEDRGIGIPAEQLPEIFTPFHRVENLATRRIRGTGLGLSIVKSLVELHGGRVWVESEIGVGSRFHVAFRAAR